jgi:predicted site-specific integrase-resolvase
LLRPFSDEIPGFSGTGLLQVALFTNSFSNDAAKVRCFMVSKQVALYLRVSTNAQSTDAQLAQLRQLVERRGWRYKVFCDKGQSGVKESRPAFDEMMR